MLNSCSVESEAAGQASGARVDGGLYHIRDVLPEILAAYAEAQEPEGLAALGGCGVTLEAEPVAC
jgi:hypothetical protein